MIAENANDPFVNRLNSYLEIFKKRKLDIEEEIKRQFAHRVKEIDDQIGTVEGMLRIAKASPTISHPAEQRLVLPLINPEGLTHKEILKEMALINNGVIKCSEAAKYFRDAKIGNAKAKNVYLGYIAGQLDIKVMHTTNGCEPVRPLSCEQKWK